MPCWSMKERARRRSTGDGSGAREASAAARALTVATLAVRLLSSPRTTRLLGRPAPPDIERPRGRAGVEARRVGHAVERVARVLPWRPVCLPQALATRWMLRRRAIA